MFKGGVETLEFFSVEIAGYLESKGYEIFWYNLLLSKNSFNELMHYYNNHCNEQLYAITFDFEGLEEVLEKLEGMPIYFTLDLDVLDPSVFPGTGTPEPGGVTFDALRKAAEKVCSRANVVACDVNELSPHYDPSGISTAAACKIVREMLLALSK